MNAIDLDDLRRWIGRENVVEDVVSLDLARKYHAMFDLAGAAPSEGEAVPRLIHFCLAQPSVPTAELGADGHPARGGFLPPVPLPRRMWAGGALRFHGDLLVGDIVRRVSRIDDVVLKEGRTGPLCFVAVSHRIEAREAVVIEERQDLVYRALESGTAPAVEMPAAELGQSQKPLTVDETLLFRYSALTFNGHRIHYDRRYAMEVEGYRGLVVHGPMQAALLLAYATELHGRAPTTFRFRGQSPLFDHDSFTLNAEPQGDGLKLWTARDGGPVCMSAEAGWA